nr:SusC/RagA family TonB-linked outer membrane protein [Parabacteroides goldsteinii]
MSNIKQIILRAALCSLMLASSGMTIAAQISIAAKNKPLREVIKDIEKSSDYRFFYNEDLTGLNTVVSVEATNGDIKKVLDKIVAEAGITYILKENNQIVLSARSAQAKQQSTRIITGRVTDQKGDPVIGANVSVKGTTNGTITDMDGDFSLEISGSPVVLVSYIGYKNREIAVGKEKTLSVQLLEDTQLLDEVVVTALGISKSERALNYSAAQLSASEISEVHSGNLLTSLGGKIAGLDITGNKRSGSTKIVLRGIGEIASGSTNKPLYVIDGVPVDNSNNTDVSPFGGTDYGDGLSGMNMDDIESISVLKGPSAAALYGSKASRGALLITTKKGVADQGIGIEFNTNTSMLMPYAGLAQYQQVYGSGQGGNYPKTLADAMAVSEDAYGAKLDPNTTSVFIDGSEHKYVSRYKPMDFYNNGFNTANTLSIIGGTKKATFRFAYGNEYYKDITPAFNYMKHNLTMRMNGDLTSRLSYDFKINFNVTNAHQRPESGHGQFNPTTVLPIMGADTDLKKLEAMGRDITTGGLMNNWDGALNPYYILYQYKNNDQSYNGNGLASVSYKILNNLKVTYRQGLEMTDFNTDQTIPQGSGFWASMAGRSDYMTKGGMSKYNSKNLLVNSDLYAEYHGEFGKFGLDAMMGGNYWSQKTRSTSVEAADFIAEGLYTPSNAKNQKASFYMMNKRMWGMYGSLDLSYNRFLYLSFTARNDWSSTLPKQNNSYFYPSVGGSLVFSELMDRPDWFSFGKIRASWAQVGSDTNAYQLDMYYGLFPGGFPTESGSTVYPGNIQNTQLPPLDLKPMRTNSAEYGLDIRFFNDRLGLDVSYYNNTTKDQILQIPIPNSSGFSSSLMNAGSVNNHGFEISLSGRPVETKDFTWDLGFTLSRNYSKVKKLHDGLKSIQMYFVEAMSVMAIEGEPYGVMYGSDYLYDDSGNIQRDANGYPLYDKSYNSYLGSAIPKVIMGLTSHLEYKDFYLNLTIDSRLGHKYYSKTSRWMYEHGTHINSVPGRDEYYANGTGLDPLKLGKIQSVTASQNVYNGGFIRMKEISLGYKLPASFISKLMLKQANVSLVFSNPFFIWRGSDFCDPTFSLNSTVGMEGIENGGEPAVRSLGINLNLKF